MTTKSRYSIRAVVFAASLAWVSTATAIPDGINFQGYLANADGTPVDTTVSLFHDVRIPGNFDVNDVVAMIL